MKRSEFLNVIKEEVEVVLTNHEMIEFFDIDPVRLLDEMMIAEAEEGEEGDEDKSFSKAAKEIEKKGTEGVFTAKAKKAGMGVQAYAAKVLAKDSKASTKTKRQAAFAKGAATVARENK